MRKILLVVTFVVMLFSIHVFSEDKFGIINISDEEFGIVQYQDGEKMATGKITFTKTLYMDTGQECFMEVDYVNEERLRTSYVLPNGDCLYISEINDQGHYRESDYKYEDDRGRVYTNTEYKGDRWEYDMRIPRYRDDEPRFDKGTIPLVFRSFPFGKIEEGQKISFRFIMPDLKKGAVHKFYVKCIGTETIKVPAGIFECYKLEMGIIGLGVIVYPHKNYFWYTKDEPHHYVRYEGVTGEGFDIHTVNEITYYKTLD